MDGKVDGVIIAKDNWQDNKKIADYNVFTEDAGGDDVSKLTAV